jgi:uncharacterized protein YgbK (DUF1537 family)/mono/diheme cytochrome c family protein
MKVIVIADDLTGAAEVAGAALRFGLTAEVQIGRVDASPADVVVIDADSRSLNADAAAATVLELTMQSLELRPDAVFKKVDSLLRGPVAAEIRAMRAAGRFQQCLLVCGNPRKRRTVVGGKIFIDNVPLHQTRFANDPEHPCNTDQIAELLTDCDATVIGDASDSADLQAHAQHWFSQRATTLAAGGAEFFEAVLAVCVAAERANDELRPVINAGITPIESDADVLLISGSSMSQCDDWPLISLHESKTSEDVANEVCQTLASHGRAGIRALDLAGGLPDARIEKLTEVASRVLAHCRPAQVWIEGGRTASTLMRELGYQRLIAVANAGDGIVALRSIDENSPLYLIKPGSYLWPTRTPSTRAAVGPVERQLGSSTNKAWIKSLLILFLSLGLSQRAIAMSPDFAPIAGILMEQCIDCHNADTQKGTVDLSRFSSLDDVDQDRSLWKLLFDVVEAKQMPLPDSGYELDDEQRTRLLSFARQALSRPDPNLKAIDPGKPILRRLTRLEYNNTVRDLFGLDYDVFMFPERLPVADKDYFQRGTVVPTVKESNHVGDQRATLGNVVETSMREYGQKYDVLLPQMGLPGDNRAEHGFANRGDALNFSPLLFEKYLEMAAAIASSDRLFADSRVLQNLLGIEPPTSKQVAETPDAVALSGQFAPKDRIGKQAAENDTWHDSFVSELTDAFERCSGGTFDIPPELNNQTIAGKGGLIKLRVQQDTLVINPNVDLWLASFATADETSGDHLLTNRNKNEKVFELTFQGEGDFDPQIQHFGVCVLARRNQSGTVRLTAVLSNGQRITRQADISDGSGNVFFSWAAPPGKSIDKLAVDGSNFSGDYVLLDDFGFIFAKRGTVVPTVKQQQRGTVVPTVKQQQRGTVVPTVNKQSNNDHGGDHRATLQARIDGFLNRAFRRQITDTELQTSVQFVESQLTSGQTETLALRRMVQAVLSSPEFLFLSEPIIESDGPVRELGPYELANRLSYFLWSSMPDNELLSVAKSGSIQDPEVLRSQIRRMLAERSHSRELSESFAVQWLRLDQLYSSKPDRKLFRKFYSGPQDKSTLHGPMMTEALLLFETVLVEDRSILDLYDPDFTWLNQQLAKLYGLEESYNEARSAAASAGLVPETLQDRSVGKTWFRTPLPDRTRGGVMTMAGPLTLTSLPFRTSPIKRGAWLLETVFNRPPSEPKVAFVLEEAVSEQSDAPQTQTVRQLFEKHRSDPNCNSCHSRIDPPGFSLEVFDAMGSLRTHDGQQPVDASGTWNDRDFASPAEFKDAIRAGEQELVRGFVEHMLSYALGRKLEHFDMPAIDQIVADTSRHGYRMSDIIECIVLSYPFRHVRNQP